MAERTLPSKDNTSMQMRSKASKKKAEDVVGQKRSGKEGQNERAMKIGRGVLFPLVEQEDGKAKENGM